MNSPEICSGIVENRDKEKEQRGRKVKDRPEVDFVNETGSDEAKRQRGTTSHLLFRHEHTYTLTRPYP